MKKVCLLGSTGSIGVQALEVIAGNPDLEVVGLSCGSRVDILEEQTRSFGVKEVAVADEAAADRLSGRFRDEVGVTVGEDAASRLVRQGEADLVLNAIVGFAGLSATVACLESGKSLALANKESLVSGGSFVTELWKKTGAAMLPVDSEHSALHQLLAGEDRKAVESVILTASGGPFRGSHGTALADVTPQDALKHPTWDMGAKITIDSATLMNKGLEVIEAHHLFGVPYSQIEVVVHPGSLVHSLVRLVDGSLLAHLGEPDMRVPIAYALNYPERKWVETRPLDLVEAGKLEFSAPDTDTFRCLELAWEAGRAGDAHTCALNAANEVAVQAFLQERLSFPGIHQTIAQVLDRLDAPAPAEYEEVAEVDAWARRTAERILGG